MCIRQMWETLDPDWPQSHVQCAFSHASLRRLLHARWNHQPYYAIMAVLLVQAAVRIASYLTSHARPKHIALQVTNIRMSMAMTLLVICVIRIVACRG
jgi:hypothetical protein